MDNLNYFFSNDSFCQTLSIRKRSISKEYDIPQKIEFKLTLYDKLKVIPKLTFNGIAVLTSPNESFSDKSKIDEGSYFAADYYFISDEYKIKIRLDIEEYEACIVSIESSHPENVLKGYENYLKKYPNYDVLKKRKL